MALIPVECIPPGCTSYPIHGGVVARANSFAYNSAQSIVLHRIESANVPDVGSSSNDGSKTRDSSPLRGPGEERSVAKGSAKSDSAMTSVMTFPLHAVYATSSCVITDFDYNDEYVACITTATASSCRRSSSSSSGGGGTPHAIDDDSTMINTAPVMLWNRASAEPLTGAKLSPGLLPMLCRDGGSATAVPSVIRLLGTHHLLVGTTQGTLLTLQLNGALEQPQSLRLPRVGTSSQQSSMALSARAASPLSELSPSPPRYPTPAMTPLFVGGMSSGQRSNDSNPSTSGALSPSRPHPHATSALDESGGVEAGRVTSLAISTPREDLLACGTQHGALFILSRDSHSGLSIVASLLPFATSAATAVPSSSSHSASKEERRSSHGGANNLPAPGLSASAASGESPATANTTATSNPRATVAIVALAFSPTTAHHLVIAGRNSSLMLFDTNSRSPVRIFDCRELTALLAVVWLPASNNNNSSAAGEMDAFVSLGAVGGIVSAISTTRIDRWSAASKSRQTSAASALPVSIDGTTQQPPQLITGLCYAGTEWLVLRMSDGVVRVYHTTRQRVEYETVSGAHSDAIHMCRLARQEKEWMASCSADGRISVWGLRQMTLQYSLTVQPSPVPGSGSSSGGSGACMCEGDTEMPSNLHDGGNIVEEESVEGAARVPPTRILALDWSPNNKQLAAGCENGEVVLFQCSTRRAVWRVGLTSGPVCGVVWPREESASVMVISGAQVLVLSAKDGQMQHRWACGVTSSSSSSSTGRGGGASLSCLDIRDGGHKTCWVAAGANDGSVHLCQLHHHNNNNNNNTNGTTYNTTGALTLRGHEGAVCDVSFCPLAPEWMLSCGVDGTLRLWNTAAQEAYRIMRGARTMRSRASGLTASYPIQVRHSRAPGTHGNRLLALHCIAWCQAAPYLAFTGRGDGVVCIWDLRLGSTLACIRAHGWGSAVTSLATHPERPLELLSAGADGSLVAWHVGVLCGAYVAAAMGTLEELVVPMSAALLEECDAQHGQGSQTHPCRPPSFPGQLFATAPEQQAYPVTGAAVQRLIQDLRESAPSAHANSATSPVNTSHTAAHNAVVPAGGTKTSSGSGGSHSPKMSKPTYRLSRVTAVFDILAGASEVTVLAGALLDPAALSSSDAVGKLRFNTPSLALLTEQSRARARQLAEKARGRTVAALGKPVRCQKLIEAAEALLRVGDVEGYCSACIDAEAWDRALAVAPAVSLEYWRSVALRAAEQCESRAGGGCGKDQAVRYWLMAGECARAAGLLRRSSTRQWETASVLCETCASVGGDGQGAAGANPAPNTQSGSSSNNNNNNNNSLLGVGIPLPTSPGVPIPAHGSASHSSRTHTATSPNASAAQALASRSRELHQERQTAIAQSGNIRIYAAALLSHGRADAAVRLLQRGGEVALNCLLVHTVPLQEQASIDGAFRLAAQQSARAGQWAMALAAASRLSNAYDGLASLLAYYTSWLYHSSSSADTIEDSTNDSNNHTSALNTSSSTHHHHHHRHTSNGNSRLSESNMASVREFAARVQQECHQLHLPLDGASIQQRHASDGLASQNTLAAMTIANGEVGADGASSAVVLQSVSGFMESLLAVVLRDADGVYAPFYLNQAYNVSSYVAVTRIVPDTQSSSTTGSSATSPTAMPSTQSAPTRSPEQSRFLALALLTAALMCVKVYRLPKLLNPAFTRARELARGQSSVENLLNEAQSILSTYAPQSTEVYCTPVGSAVPVYDGSKGGLATSTLTGEVVRGVPVTVDDESGWVMSREESMAWGLCCHFSPLGCGARWIPV